MTQYFIEFVQHCDMCTTTVKYSTFMCTTMTHEYCLLIPTNNE